MIKQQQSLDEALMCQGSFGGRSDEFIIWGYGADSISCFNGVVLLGNQVSSYDVKEKNGLRYTDFNRTVADALANEDSHGNLSYKVSVSCLCDQEY